MRTIEGQTIASTTLDLHGERITRELLTSLFNQMPTVQVVNQDHDLGKPIIAKIYNKRLVDIGDGDLEIKVDVIVLDEAEFKKRGGFSIAFAKKLYTVNSERDGDVKILFNSRLIDPKDITPLIAISDESVQIDAQELVQKDFQTVAILVLVFITLAIANGFFEEPGADAYKILKSKLKELGDRYRAERKCELKFNFSFKASIGDQLIDVIIESDTDSLSIISQQSIAIQPLLEQVLPYAEVTRIARITLQIRKELPYLQLIHIVDEDGRDISVLGQTGE